ncbi:hypothetical protein DUZ99_00565 [Xylanibacillus composti]|uniref:Uncharacterized protein n=1 Tax=Xylanibacillus composti TaxID=1572762 RepID=A0A8J4H2J0_9BACL|nr:hypothetical protein [Xylanibacillus composti]MDT9723509.1 hypothetical protein [Xylanibacillus composti]GIQ68455.1 hypothetical protein XYCOK13_12790 [Xylanibacillus composti]
MKYVICQSVSVTDMSNEVLQEKVFHHGELETASVSIGCSVITSALGLKEFEVVYDLRYNEKQRCKIVDIEYDMAEKPVVARAYLEPVRLIVGQHDVGQV